MSTSVYSQSELSEIASQLFKTLNGQVSTYEERMTAKSESNSEYEKRSEGEILSDEYRWIWERISIANQLEALQNYTKYGEACEIWHNHIEIHKTGDFFNLKELHNQLRLVRYNSSKYLTQEISQKLDSWIEQTGELVIRNSEKIEVFA